MFQDDKDALSRRMREILHQCYKFGFEVNFDVVLCLILVLFCFSVSQGAGQADYRGMFKESAGTRSDTVLHAVDEVPSIHQEVNFKLNFQVCFKVV
jgi:hypothetical protein